MRRLLVGVACLAVVGASLLIPVGGGSATGSEPLLPRAAPNPIPAALAPFSSDRPKSPLRLLFVHHSVGGRLLADAGPKEAIADEIWKSHPNGGGLRRALEQQGYEVHEASYGSQLGSDTDFGDWLPKFRDKLQSGLACAMNDQILPAGQHNQIVVWKSCFPNNQLDDEAALQRARDSLTALLPVFAQHPEVLFVHVTTPPLAPRAEKEPVWRALARVVLRKPQPGPRLIKSGPLARRLDDWVTSPDGWLKDYPHKNVAVFDLYDILTDHGKSNFLAFPTGDGYDSHPSRAGNELAAAAFVPFLNRAVHRAGLAD